MYLYSNQWTIYSFTYVYINNYRRYGLAIPCGSFWKIRDSVNTCTRQCQLDARPLGGSWPSWTGRKLDQPSAGCRSYPGHCLRRSKQPPWTGGPNPKDLPKFVGNKILVPRLHWRLHHLPAWTSPNSAAPERRVASLYAQPWATRWRAPPKRMVYHGKSH